MDLIDGLDAAQREAVTSTAAPLCILAGAGSGKTRVLTRRIAYRVASGEADAARVLALTFTRAAAAALRDRLAGLGVREQVAAGTFHAVAYAQLRRRWADHGLRAPALLERKTRLLASILGTDAVSRVADYATEVEWAKARMVTPASYEPAAESAGRTPPCPGARMAAVFEQYEAEKRRRGLVDFEDLLLACAGALERDERFAAAQRWRFRHLFVDEFQDVNPAQFRLLRAWLGDRLDLCVVGDPDQAIYAWNGADPHLLTALPRAFPTTGVVRLATNYRSTPQVVATASAVTDGDGRRDGAVRSVRADGPVPSVRCYPTDRAETEGVVRGVRSAHRPGAPWRHIAVLARTNAQLAPLEAALVAAGVPHRCRGGAFLDRPAVESGMRALRAGGPGVPFASRVRDLIAMADEASAADRLELVELVRLAREYEALVDGAGPGGFVAWLRSALGGAGEGAGGDAVAVTTFHRAKGLEWPVVFVTGLERGLVPVAYATTAAALAEERRLLYVALTRAVDELHCSWASERASGAGPQRREPSPWLSRIEAAIADLAPGWSGPGDGPEAWREHVAASRAELARISR